jgi:hypothetical protein
MTQIKERYQNPTIDETVRLRLYFYNSNNFSDVYQIKEVNIFHLPQGVAQQDIGANYLIQTIPGDQVVNDGTGKYYVDIYTTDGVYTIGYYTDVWTVNYVNDNLGTSEVKNLFQVYSNLWYSTPIPMVYDFNFFFRPSQVRIGSRQYLIIQVNPNVPKGTDLQRYYENLAIVGNIFVTIEQRCGNCLPREQDLRIIVDKEPVQFREKEFGYYYLDTSICGFEVGIYDIWFQLDIGDNIFISPRFQLQIFP